MPLLLPTVGSRTPQYYHQALVGFKIWSISFRHIRRSSSNSQHTSLRLDLSKTRSDHPVSTSIYKPPRAADVERQAFRARGRDALATLKNIEDGNIGRALLMGTICLQAYYDRICRLSVEDAQNVIAADGAGQIVEDWVSQQNIWERIECNIKDAEILMYLVTYILVGARQIATIETWMKDTTSIPSLDSSSKIRQFEEQFKWKSIMMSLATIALISWHPEGLADSGYDFFSRKFDESWLGLKEANNRSFSKYLWNRTLVILENRYITTAYPASSRSFEGCANRIAAYWRLLSPFGHGFRIGTMALNHPNRPSADHFLAACRELHRDRDHPLRSYHPISKSDRSTSMRDYALFRCATAIEASGILNNEGRYIEGKFVWEVVHSIWGLDGEFFNSDSNLYPKRLERWKLRNEETMNSLHLRSYTPVVF
ncbi:hypothetical protein F4803DRAFT_497349 [Xylaria telfairii]|nr:hypothetical protein F4803DRAFT_497349 [Xylaria telfairii]